MEAFYVEVFGGSCLPSETRREYLQRAQEVLERFERVYTNRTRQELPRKKAICAMAEAMHYFDTAQNGLGGMRYASVGTVSVSGKGIYKAVDISPEAQERELYRCACNYLDFCRGVPEGAESKFVEK